jgi:uncharacterized protein (UPF0548 family)
MGWTGRDDLGLLICRDGCCGPGRVQSRYRARVNDDAARVLARWETAELTYDRPGATREEILPAGYDHLDIEASIGRGRAAFDRAADGLLTWRMHARAGLRVAAVSADRATPGVLVLLQVGPGPLGLRIPCRVVYIVDEVNYRGFGYGTLPGHPERGEEAFTVRLTLDGEVRARVRAFSRPATLLARAGGPMTRLAQRFAARRYIGALQRLAA